MRVTPIPAAASGGGGAAAAALTPTAVKTANYTASAGDFVPVDTTSAAVTVTLPTAPASGSLVGVKLVIGAVNAVTIACGGSDVFNKAGGSTSGTLSLVNQGVLLLYKSGVWYVEADDLPLSQMDARFGRFANWKPSGVLIESVPGRFSDGSLYTVNDGRIHGFALPLPLRAGVPYSSISFFSGNGGSGLTHQWFCFVARSDSKVKAITVDDTTTAWGANTKKTLAFASPYVPAADIDVYACLMLTATVSRPDLRSTTQVGNLANASDAPIITGLTAASYTTPINVGDTVTLVPNNANYAYLTVN